MKQLLKRLFAWIFLRKKNEEVDVPLRRGQEEEIKSQIPKEQPEEIRAVGDRPKPSAPPEPKVEKRKYNQEIDLNTQKVVGRRFLGQLFPERREDRNYETAHLRAYLKGKKTFSYGFYFDKSGQRLQATHEVKQEYILVPR